MVINMEKDTIIEILYSKEKKEEYEIFKDLLEKASNDKSYYDLFDEYLRMLSSKQSHIRYRGFAMIVKTSKWNNGNINEDVFNVLNDEKAYVSRLCLALIDELLVHRKDLFPMILDRLSNYDYKKYNSTMIPLIKKDIEKIITKG